MDLGALRQLEAMLAELLHRIPDTDMVGSPYLEQYERAVDRAVELGFDADPLRVAASTVPPEAVERRYLLMQIASLASRVRNCLKRGGGPARGPVDPLRS